MSCRRPVTVLRLAVKPQIEIFRFGQAMEAAWNPVQAAPLKQECMRGSNRTPNRHVVLQSYTLQRSFAPLNSQARSPPTAHIAKALLGSGVDVPAGDVPEASAAADDSWSLGAQGSAVFPVKLKLQVRIWASGQPRQLAAFVTPLHFPAWLRAAFDPLHHICPLTHSPPTKAYAKTAPLKPKHSTLKRNPETPQQTLSRFTADSQHVVVVMSRPQCFQTILSPSSAAHEE